MRSILSAFCACAILTGLCLGQAVPVCRRCRKAARHLASKRALRRPTRSPAAPPVRAGGQPTNITARPGPVTSSNPSTGIVDVNRSRTQPLGPNSPPPSRFENSCAPAPYLFQSKAGYEAVRVKDCRNDQLVYLPTSAQAQINIYVEDCQRRCGAR